MKSWGGLDCITAVIKAGEHDRANLFLRDANSLMAYFAVIKVSQMMQDVRVCLGSTVDFSKSEGETYEVNALAENFGLIDQKLRSSGMLEMVDWDTNIAYARAYTALSEVLTQRMGERESEIMALYDLTDDHGGRHGDIAHLPIVRHDGSDSGDGCDHS